MAHNPSGKHSPSARVRRIRKLIAAAKRQQRGKQENRDSRGLPIPPAVLPPAWSSALARVKKHIQAERRNRY